MNSISILYGINSLMLEGLEKMFFYNRKIDYFLKIVFKYQKNKLKPYKAKKKKKISNQNRRLTVQ